MIMRGAGYEVETTCYHMGAVAYQIRTLRDRRQFSDQDGCAERAGISSASWPIFGIVWPAGLALAEEMSRFPVEGRHILEVGCGDGRLTNTFAERARSVIVLHDVEGYTHVEIGEMLGIPGGTARSDLHHARQKLRELLKDLRG